MPSLRIYFDAKAKNNVEEIKEMILSDPNNYAKFDNESIMERGFHQKLLDPVIGDYYISDYFEIERRNVATVNTELAYFKYIKASVEGQSHKYPILIKIIYNPHKKVICFYTRVKINNELSDTLLSNLREKYHFNFIFIPTIFEYKRNQLDALVNALGIKDFTAISVWDGDNKVIIKNPKKISETKRYFEIVEQQSKGNWSHLKVPFEELNIEIRINNTTSQKFITFINDYIDDLHLVQAVDFLVNKIYEVEDFSGKKQTMINSFY